MVPRRGGAGAESDIVNGQNVFSSRRNRCCRHPVKCIGFEQPDVNEEGERAGRVDVSRFYMGRVRVARRVSSVSAFEEGF